MGMKKLLFYFNSLQPAERESFLDHIGISENYLRAACSRMVRFSPELCVAIEVASAGNVSRKDLRENWHLIWPELVEK